MGNNLKIQIDHVIPTNSKNCFIAVYKENLKYFIGKFELNEKHIISKCTNERTGLQEIGTRKKAFRCEARVERTSGLRADFRKEEQTPGLLRLGAHGQGGFSGRLGPKLQEGLFGFSTVQPVFQKEADHLLKKLQKGVQQFPVLFQELRNFGSLQREDQADRREALESRLTSWRRAWTTLS